MGFISFPMYKPLLSEIHDWDLLRERNNILLQIHDKKCVFRIVEQNILPLTRRNIVVSGPKIEKKDPGFSWLRFFQDDLIMSYSVGIRDLFILQI